MTDEARKLEYACQQIERLQKTVGWLYSWAEGVQNQLESIPPVAGSEWAMRTRELREKLKEARA